MGSLLADNLERLDVVMGDTVTAWGNILPNGREPPARMGDGEAEGSGPEQDWPLPGNIT